MTRDPSSRGAARSRDRHVGLTVLRKILAKEDEGGYEDRAVIGGLDRFLGRHADELRSSLGEIRPYSVLTSAERRSWAFGGSGSHQCAGCGIDDYP